MRPQPQANIATTNGCHRAPAFQGTWHMLRLANQGIEAPCPLRVTHPGRPQALSSMPDGLRPKGSYNWLMAEEKVPAPRILVAAIMPVRSRATETTAKGV